jgi:hypothetical protein
MLILLRAIGDVKRNSTVTMTDADVLKVWGLAHAPDAHRVAGAGEVFDDLRTSLAEMLQWCPAQRGEWMSEEAYEEFRNVRGRAVAALGRADAPSIKEAFR